MVRLLIMDVDGTLTDGSIYYDDCGHEIKKFNVKDGAGVKMLQKKGIQTMILTGRKSQCVKKRAEELKIDYILQGIEDKAKYLHEFVDQKGWSMQEIAYIGDDINDLECMRIVGHKAAPADAVEDVLEVVDYICDRKGSQGAVREYAEYLIRRRV